jgi:hypothetical protein
MKTKNQIELTSGAAAKEKAMKTLLSVASLAARPQETASR